MPHKKELSDNCPICSEKMEKGYLRCLELWGWGWVKEKKTWTMGWCIKARRCRNCKIIITSSNFLKS